MLSLQVGCFVVSVILEFFKAGIAGSSTLRDQAKDKPLRVRGGGVVKGQPCFCPVCVWWGVVRGYLPAADVCPENMSLCCQI